MAGVFAHGELRLYLLALLADGPRHGYELITALAHRFGGTYRPSAGTVYPRLARLEEEGLVRRVEFSADDDGRRSAPYELTDAGRAELEARADDLARLESSVAETVRTRAQGLRDDVKATMSGLRAEIAAAAAQVRAQPAPTAEPDPRRATSYVARREAEAILARFRADVVADLRRADVDGVVTELAVETTRTVLDEARAAIRSALGRA